MSSAAMHIARTGLDAQDMRMRVISNNLANVNTTGFKRDRASFADAGLSDGDRRRRGEHRARRKYATGPQPRHRRAHPGHCPDGHAGVDADHRQRARHGAGRRRLFPGADAGRPARLYARGQFLALGPKACWSPPKAIRCMPGITVPEGTTAITVGTDGTVSATVAGPDRADASSARSRSRPSPIRAGCRRRATTI